MRLEAIVKDIEFQDEKRVKEYADWIRKWAANKREHLTQIDKVNDKIDAIELTILLISIPIPQKSRCYAISAG